MMKCLFEYLKNNLVKTILFILVFAFYFFVATYKLLHASIWFDEAIEYYFGKYFFQDIGFGILPMYERLIHSSLQPPLYSLVMYIWLNIFDSEYMFRFFGVLMGAVGALGIFKAVNKKAGFYYALLAVFFTLSSCHYIYYVQECAEYNLLLAFVSWLIYWFIKVLDEPNRKNLILFTLFAVLSVWTQYGAVFIASAFALILIYKTLREKDYLFLKIQGIVYSTALIVFALPLYYFFARIQMQRGDIAEKLFQIHFLKNNFFYDFIYSYFEKFCYALSFETYKIKAFLLTNPLVQLTFICIVFLMLLTIFMLIKTKNKTLKYLLSGALLTWLLNHIFVKLGLYAYGKFENRYENFFIPIIIVVCVVALSIFQNEVIKKYSLKAEKISIITILTILLLGISFPNLVIIEKNWEKVNYRGLVNTWLKQECYKEKTFITNETKLSFNYYLHYSKSNIEEYKDNVIILPWSNLKYPYEEYRSYIYQSLNNNFPNELYLCFAQDDKYKNLLFRIFIEKGYENIELVYYSSKVFIYKFSHRQ